MPETFMENIEAFKSAIQKLSLAEAAEDVQVHGMALKCREKERAQIAGFLREVSKNFFVRNHSYCSFW